VHFRGPHGAQRSAGPATPDCAALHPGSGHDRLGFHMSVPDPDHVLLPPGKPLGNPLAAAVVVVYATLALLALAVPRGLVNWSRDMEPSARQQAMLAAAQAIERFSGWVGLNRPYEWARRAFLEATGKSED
jgi:hypothetical protein